MLLPKRGALRAIGGGCCAIYLALDSYLIHGTNKPADVGRLVSHGCIRMYEEDVADLFQRVSADTPVAIVYQPVKLGWHDGELYLEAHPLESDVQTVEAHGRAPAVPDLGIAARILAQVDGARDRIDWPAVGAAARARNGLPVRITREPT